MLGDVYICTSVHASFEWTKVHSHMWMANNAFQTLDSQSCLLNFDGQMLKGVWFQKKFSRFGIKYSDVQRKTAPTSTLVCVKGSVVPI